MTDIGKPDSAVSDAEFVRLEATSAAWALEGWCETAAIPEIPHASPHANSRTLRRAGLKGEEMLGAGFISGEGELLEWVMWGGGGVGVRSAITMGCCRNPTTALK
jgi:hypothetical protein